MFANGPRDLGLIPGRIIPKAKKIVFGSSLLRTQHYKVMVKWSNPVKGVVPCPTLGVVAIEKGAFGSTATIVANFTLLSECLP